MIRLSLKVWARHGWEEQQSSGSFLALTTRSSLPVSSPLTGDLIIPTETCVNSI